MIHDNYPDSYIRGILNTVKSIAMVGVSPKDNRPSYFAFKQVLECEIARPVVLGRGTDHRDGLHGVENAADVAVVVIVVIHAVRYGARWPKGPAAQTKRAALSDRP